MVHSRPLYWVLAGLSNALCVIRMDVTVRSMTVSMTGKRVIRTYWKTILKVAISVGGLAYVVYQVPFAQILSEYAGANVGWLLIAVTLMMISLVVRAYRWSLLLHGIGVTVAFGRLVTLYFVGNFFNAFLPSGFGGDVVRIIEIAEDVPGDVAVGTVIVDRLTGLMMLFVMALLVLPLRPESFPVTLSIAIGVVCILGLLIGVVLLQGSLIMRPLTWLQQFDLRTVNTAIEKFVSPIMSAIHRCGVKAVIEALAVSVVFNLMLVGWWYASGNALDYPIPYTYYLLVIPILSIVMLVPSIGGLGVRELIAPALFSGAGLPPESAFALSLLVFVLMRLSSLLGSPIYILSVVRRAPVTNPQLSEVENE